MRLCQDSFEDYVQEYHKNLENYLNEFEDNTEEIFIRKQKSIWNHDIAELKQAIKTIEEPSDPETAEEILKVFENKINTHYKVVTFLNKRIEEIDKGLIGNYKKGTEFKVESFGLTAPDYYLESIYSKLKKDILHDDTTLEEFKTVLSEPWNSNKNTIKFNCTNYFVAALIDFLKNNHFTNLNRATAGNSCKFLSKTGTVLSEDNLNNSFKQYKFSENLESLIKQLLNS